MIHCNNCDAALAFGPWNGAACSVCTLPGGAMPGTPLQIPFKNWGCITNVIKSGMPNCIAASGAACCACWVPPFCAAKGGAFARPASRAPACGRCFLGACAGAVAGGLAFSFRFPFGRAAAALQSCILPASPPAGASRLDWSCDAF